MNPGYLTYLINLDEDTKRLEFIRTQLCNSNMVFERISAVRGLAMPDWAKPYLLNDDGGIASKLNPGEIGCYASHVVVMQRVIDSGMTGLVLEDDIEITPGLAEVMSCLHELPSDWDIIRLSSHSNRVLFPVGIFATGQRVVKYAPVPVNTGAYLITPDGAHKFLSHKGRRRHAVDQDLRMVWQNRMVTYGIYPPPVLHNRFGPSSIARFGRISRNQDRAILRTVDKVRRFFFEMHWIGHRNWLRSRLWRKAMPHHMDGSKT